MQESDKGDCMIKEWAEDIRTKTREMSRDEKVEYIMAYYWYHILIAVVLTGLLVLGIYHVSWGKRRTDFSMVIVNQDINAARDQAIGDGFAEFSDSNSKYIQIDSDYMISYADHKLEGVNESSYEKFFFGWSVGAIDAMIMPESFYQYCKEQGGTFLELSSLAEYVPKERKQELRDCLEEQKDCLFEDQGKAVGIYASETAYAKQLMQNEEDPFVLVFPGDIKHREAGAKFLEYILAGSKICQQHRLTSVHVECFMANFIAREYK